MSAKPGLPNGLAFSRRERVVSRSKIARLSRAERSAAWACWASAVVVCKLRTTPLLELIPASLLQTRNPL